MGNKVSFEKLKKIEIRISIFFGFKVRKIEINYRKIVEKGI